LKSIIGEKFGRLTVIGKIKAGDTKDYKTRYICVCDCNNKNIIKVPSYKLKSGHTKSCGCLAKERIIKFNKDTKKKYNTYDLLGEYGIGYTEKGEEFYFDLEDYDLIKNYYWGYDTNDYICTCFDKRILYLHRLIMNPLDDEIIDHINHIVYDNRKNNLRICTISQNFYNKIITNRNTSGVKGVSWNTKREKWIAQINVDKQNIYLGSFGNFEDAVKIRKEAEIKYHREFRYQDIQEDYFAK